MVWEKNHQGKWGPECGGKRGHAALLNKVVLVGLTEETLRRLTQRLEGGKGVSLEETGKSIHGRDSLCAYECAYLIYLRISKETNMVETK